jgi:hypothetical protein
VLQTHVYQAWLDKEATILLAESNSYNSLADQLKISVGYGYKQYRLFLLKKDTV